MNTKGPPLKVEVLDEDERTIVATFTAPTQEAQTIPPGHYHMRLSADGHLSETSLFDADKGNHYDLSVALAARTCGRFRVRDWRIRTSWHDWTATTMYFWQPGTNSPLGWRNRAARMASQPGGKGSTARCEGADAGRRILPCLGRATRAPNSFHLASYGRWWTWMATASPDLIWASRATASLVAISGKSGKVRWCHRGRTTLPEGLDQTTFRDTPFLHRNDRGPSAHGGNRRAEDRGGDVLRERRAIRHQEADMKWISPPPQLWLDAVDAQTGETLWRHRCHQTSNSVPADPASTTAESKQTRSRSPIRRHRLFSRRSAQRRPQTCAIAYGNRLFGFDFLTGQPAWPDRQLDDKPPVVVRFADLKGDGQLDVLFVREGATNRITIRTGRAHESVPCGPSLAVGQAAVGKSRCRT